MLDVASFLADRCFQDLYLAHYLTKTVNGEKEVITSDLYTDNRGKDKCYDSFRKEICETTPLIRALREPPRICSIFLSRHQRSRRFTPASARAVMSPKLTHVNVHAPERETKKVVNSVVRLDRLPTENSPEALKLLHEAWCEYDVAMHLATHYKYIAKFLYEMHLAVGVAIVVFGVVLEKSEGPPYAPTSFLSASTVPLQYPQLTLLTSKGGITSSSASPHV